MSDEMTAPVSDQDNTELEVWDNTENKFQSSDNRVLGIMDLNNPKQQIVIGGASGWLVGYLFKKFGKGIASAVGGGLLIIQVANKSGYIHINWKKLDKDTKKMQTDITRDIQQRHPELQSYFSKAKTQIKENTPISVGFIGGFLVGMAS